MYHVLLRNLPSMNGFPQTHTHTQSKPTAGIHTKFRLFLIALKHFIPQEEMDFLKSYFVCPYTLLQQSIYVISLEVNCLQGLSFMKTVFYLMVKQVIVQLSSSIFFLLNLMQFALRNIVNVTYTMLGEKKMKDMAFTNNSNLNIS